MIINTRTRCLIDSRAQPAKCSDFLLLPRPSQAIEASTQSPLENVRKPAEELLKACEELPGYTSVLAAIAGKENVVLSQHPCMCSAVRIHKSGVGIHEAAMVPNTAVGGSCGTAPSDRRKFPELG